MYPTKLLTIPIEKKDLEIFKANPFDSMIEYVVDINKSLLAIGGKLHSDSEKVLLKNDSIQESIWGANIYSRGMQIL